ncbi:MAG TPA: hypothetical protein QGH18_04525 [Arenicellales bacterium]|nr:hypothetical protein [Arenicellales bacterium]
MPDRPPKPGHESVPLPPVIGRLLCGVGWHDYRIIDVTVGFGPGGSVEKRQCRRCQAISVRRSR